MDVTDLDQLLRSTLALHARLAVPIADIGDSTDLYACGMSSYATVAIMLGLEEELGIEFPDELLQRQTFASLGNMKTALQTLLASAS